MKIEKQTFWNQDEIKTEKFELNKFHASKKDPFY
jgi:hypothetical protein